MQPNHQVQQPEASQAQQLSPATPSPSSLAAAAAAAPPLPPGMDAELYKAASSGSFEAISPISNWKHQLTPTQNNILHIHVGKSPFFKKVKRAHLRDAMVDIEFIKQVLQDDEGYWMLWKQNNNGDTPLHIAARFGHYDAVNAFLEQAKKVYQPADDVKRMLKMTNNKKDTTLHVVARAGHAEVVKLLVEADPDCAHNKPNEKGETPVYLAAESGSTTSVLSILQNYKALDLAYKGPCGRTALHAAVQWGKPKMVEKIVEKGRWLMTIQDEEGLTPLHCAAAQRQTIGLLKILLDKDKHERESSAAYIRDNMGRTPLHIAMLRRNYDALDKLIESTPDCIEIVDNNGQNVLHYAAKWAFPKTTHWLRKRALHFDKYINDRDNDGNTPLHIFAAAVNRNPDLPFISNMLNSVVINYPSVDLKAFDKQNHSVGDIFGSYSELGHLEQINLVQPIIQGTLQKWRPPQKGFFKLNIDGRWQGIAEAGGGGVIRNDEGAWMHGFSATYYANSPCTSELMALRDGLKLARAHHITLLEVETDAKSLKCMLDSDMAKPNNSLLPLLYDVAELIKGDWVVMINHIPRSANEVAHLLARLSRGLDDNFVVHNTMPSFVAAAFKKDLENIPSSSTA